MPALAAPGRGSVEVPGRTSAGRLSRGGAGHFCPGPVCAAPAYCVVFYGFFLYIF